MISLKDSSVQSDEDLLQGICEKNVAALETLYERYKGQAFGLAYRMTSSREGAEEILQDAFLAVWQRAATYSSTAGRVRPWLFSIIHHRAVDYVRRSTSRRTAVLDEALLLPGGQDVFADVYSHLNRDQVRSALDQLPPEQRRSLELFYFGGLTFSEIAEALALPVGTVKSRVRLAIGRLRGLLEEVVEQ